MHKIVSCWICRNLRCSTVGPLNCKIGRRYLELKLRFLLVQWTWNTAMGQCTVYTVYWVPLHYVHDLAVRYVHRRFSLQSVVQKGTTILCKCACIFFTESTLKCSSLIIGKIWYIFAKERAYCTLWIIVYVAYDRMGVVLPPFKFVKKRRIYK